MTCAASARLTRRVYNRRHGLRYASHESGPARVCVILPDRFGVEPSGSDVVVRPACRDEFVGAVELLKSWQLYHSSLVVQSYRFMVIRGRCGGGLRRSSKPRYRVLRARASDDSVDAARERKRAVPCSVRR